MPRKPREEKIDVTIPRPSFVGAEDEISFGPLERGQAVGFGTDRSTGRPTGVSSNISGVVESAGQLGVPDAAPPRPDVIGNLANIPRPSQGDAGALSAAQQGFLRGEGTNLSSGALRTPQQKQEDRRAESAGQLEAAKDFAREQRIAPQAEAGRQARLTEGVKASDRTALEETKGRIKADLQDASLSSKEKIANLKDATTIAQGELNRAAKSGDVRAQNEAKRDLANLNNTARIEEAKLNNTFDVESETRGFIQAARLQAQREGIDFKQSLLKTAADPFVHKDIRDAIISQGIDNLVAPPEAIATPEATPAEAPAATPEAPAQAEGTGVVGQTDADGDGTPETQVQINEARDVVAKWPTREQAAQVLNPTQLVEYDRAVAIDKAFTKKLNQEASALVGL